MSVFVNDPFEMIADIYNDLFSDKYYVAQYGYAEGEVKEMDAKGETFFPDDGGTPVITLFVNVPMEHLPEIFAHELAHVAVGIEHEHDEVWEKAFDDINKEYIRRMEASE